MALSQAFTTMMFITVHPQLLAPGILTAIDICVAVGQSPLETLQELSEAVKQAPPEPVAARRIPDEVLVWRRKTADAPY
ncbi:MAG TPA: hypothetical protein VNN62_07770 [Methylomirabilota bacterium]|jgi:hypothetical protein|nr:hypothetical protein [Methylomirabilota bacterium]